MTDERRQQDIDQALEQGSGTSVGGAKVPVRRGLMRSGLVVSSMTMLSRVLGQKSKNKKKSIKSREKKTVS